VTQSKFLPQAFWAAAAILLSGTTVQAQDAEEFAGKFAETYRSGGYDVDFGPGEVDGDTIRYDGVTITLVGAPEPSEPMTLDTTLTFDGVVRQADGSYRAESLSVPDVDLTAEGVHVLMRNLVIKDIYLPAEIPDGFAAALQMAAHFSAGPLEVSVPDAGRFAMESFTSETEFFPAQDAAVLERLSAVTEAKGLEIDLSTVTEPQARAVIDALGLGQVSGEGRQVMSWSMDDGRMQVTESSITLDGLGKLDFTMDISGYTPELMSELSILQAELTALPEAERRSREEAMGMDLLQRFTVAGLALRYEDQSLAGRLLDYFAQAQNADRATFVAGLQVIVPALLAQSGSATLVDQAGSAVTDFLADPQSFEARLAPATPVNMLTLVQTGDPEAIAQMLGLSIAANAPAAPPAETAAPPATDGGSAGRR